MSLLVVDRLTVRHGQLTAVNAVSLRVHKGEFLSLLGPSGCGKTTSLRMIAGFEQPDAGRVLLQGEDVTWVSPRKRNVNMVFQAYGLFPHMTVAQNVAFGLEIKRVAKAEREQRVAEMRMTRPQGVDRNARPTKRERRQLERVKGRRER
jgi:ABC-type Fe3+/spermidine/putrescine transport system ATPase subunit